MSAKRKTLKQWKEEMVVAREHAIEQLELARLAKGETRSFHFAIAAGSAHKAHVISCVIEALKKDGAK